MALKKAAQALNTARKKWTDFAQKSVNSTRSSVHRAKAVSSTSRSAAGTTTGSKVLSNAKSVNGDSLLGNVTENPVSANGLLAAGATTGVAYGASTMADSESSASTPIPDIANPVTGVYESAKGRAKQVAFNAAMPESREIHGGLNTSTGLVAGAAMSAGGLAAGAYQYMSEQPATNSKNLVSGPDWAKGPNNTKGPIQTKGPSVSNADGAWGKTKAAWRKTKAKTKAAGKKGMSVTKRSAAKAPAKGTNYLYKSGRGLRATAAATFGAAAVASTINTFVEGVAEDVAAAGTPGDGPQTDVTEPQRETKRSSPTGRSVADYGGNMQNEMSGATVLALHKTGGQGGVLR